jgi:hypothetical protein
MRWTPNGDGGYPKRAELLESVVGRSPEIQTGAILIMVTAKRTRKPKLVAFSPKATAAPIERVPSTNLEEAIRSRAYAIFEQRGREHGHDLDDWLIAEAEVVGKAFAQSA